MPDPLLRKLAKIANARRVIESQINFVDIAGLVKGILYCPVLNQNLIQHGMLSLAGAHEGKGLGNQFLANVRSVDALVHVVRCFEDENIIHVEESVDPIRDIQIIRDELILADLQSVEKRLGSISKKVSAPCRILFHD